MASRGEENEDGDVQFKFPMLFRELPGYADNWDLDVSTWQGYDKWRDKQRTRSKKVTQETLQEYESRLAMLLLEGYMDQEAWAPIKTAVEELKDLLKNWRVLHLEARRNKEGGKKESGSSCTFLFILIDNNKNMLVGRKSCLRYRKRHF